MRVKIDDDDVSNVVAQMLLESAPYAERKKDRKALRRAAAYFMTYKETVAAFGQEEADEYWK